MIRSALAVLACASTLLQPSPALAAAEYKIVTASERGTYIQIGRDLANFVAPAADITLETLPSAGSAENVRRLRFEPGVKFALVQSDVYQAFIDQAREGNADAARMVNPLRVIMPLYNEEIYFIVRADAPLEHIHEIKDKKINIGLLGSGTRDLADDVAHPLHVVDDFAHGRTGLVDSVHGIEAPQPQRRRAACVHGRKRLPRRPGQAVDRVPRRSIRMAAKDLRAACSTAACPLSAVSTSSPIRLR